MYMVELNVSIATYGRFQRRLGQHVYAFCVIHHRGKYQTAEIISAVITDCDVEFCRQADAVVRAFRD